MCVPPQVHPSSPRVRSQQPPSLPSFSLPSLQIAILCTTLGVVIRVVPVYAAVAALLALAFVYFFRIYMASSALLKELAGSSHAGVVAHVAETLSGLAVIRAYGVQTQFRAEASARLDTAQLAGSNLAALQVWLSFRLDALACLLVLATCLLGVGLGKGIAPALGGLALSNSFQILLFFSLMVQTAAEMHASVASVERIVQLSKVEPEEQGGDMPPQQLPVVVTAWGGDSDREQGSAPAPSSALAPYSWPSRGAVSYSAVRLSYFPASPLVLKGVSFAVAPGEKVGVVGRTGSGKSTLLMGECQECCCQRWSHCSACCCCC